MCRACTAPPEPGVDLGRDGRAVLRAVARRAEPPMIPPARRWLSGRGWAYAGAILGGLTSIAANVAHSYVPPQGSPARWQPQSGAVLAAVVWPVCAQVVPGSGVPGSGDVLTRDMRDRAAPGDGRRFLPSRLCRVAR